MAEKYVKIVLSDGRVIQDGQLEYVIAKNGVFKKVENNVITGYVKVDTVPFLPKFDEGIKVKIPKKIPLNLYVQIYTWFCKFSSEVFVFVFWNNTEQKYFVVAPPQVVTGASVKYKRLHKLERKHRLIAEIHSHNQMGDFFSGGDDKDEQTGIIYGVISTTGLFESTFRIKIWNTEYKLNLEDIIEMPEVPQEWNKHVRKLNGKNYLKINGELVNKADVHFKGRYFGKDVSSTPLLDGHHLDNED